MTHDCKRHGTTTLFAALDVLTGTIGQCLPKHRHNEFLTFLRTIDRAVPQPLANTKTSGFGWTSIPRF
ncbi:hypothetical protein BKP42_63060 [Rhodococcus erythropolis]|nr:hypothetical protein BKP42_63060 [Rhodococcus erythropolis]